MGKQIAGFQQQWFGRMHRIDKFFHRVKPPPGAEMNTHKGYYFWLCIATGDFIALLFDTCSMIAQSARTHS